MRTLNIIIVLILFFLSMACNSSTEPESISGISNPAITVNLSYVDESGNDLLDSTNPNGWTEEDITIYYLKQGEKETVFDPDMKYPKNIQMRSDPVHGNYINLILNPYLEDNHSITYIEFPNGETDTLKIHAEMVKDVGMWGDKFWYNGELLFNTDGEMHFDVGYHTFTKSVN